MSNRRTAVLVSLAFCATIVGCVSGHDGGSKSASEVQEARAVGHVESPPEESVPSDSSAAAPGSQPNDGKDAAIVPLRLDSLEAVASKVIAAINDGDRRVLLSLLVERDEYETVLWPAFVAKNPSLSLQTWQLQWRLLAAKSHAGSGDVLEEFRGKRVELVAVDHESIDDYGSFRLWRKPTMRLLVDGHREVEKRIIGSIIERDGKFYLLSYPS